MLEDRAGGDIATLARAADTLVDAARKRPELANVISTFRAVVPGYYHRHGYRQAADLGIPVTDAYNTLQTFLGGLYVNDFNQFGHTWQVLLQAEPEFRDQPSDDRPLLCAQHRRRHGAAGHAGHDHAHRADPT